ncbi:MAG: hypothetical protein EB127_01265 [Alphaproteobacteria bacterium]|nr:hypothetical protein [Alphaproteobacteria bacterium]
MAILSKQIGWSNESNLLWEILKKLNRLAGIIGGLKPKYKVFTALVSQDGNRGPDSLSNVPLTIGVTYEITSPGEGNDWTVVGAPNNNLGTSFIATGTNPIWGIDGELSFETGAPVATVLENTIGNIWFKYNNVGEYVLNSNNLFTVDKTMIIGSTYYYDGETTILLSSYYGDNTDSSILLKSTNLGELTNSALYQSSLEIRVYN